MFICRQRWLRNGYCLGLLLGLITDMRKVEERFFFLTSPTGMLNWGGHVLRRLLFVCNQCFPVSHDVWDEPRRGGRAVHEKEKREGRKTSGQQSSIPQTGNVSLWMPQLLCLASLLLQLNQSSMKSSYNNFQVSVSENNQFRLPEFSHYSVGTVLWHGPCCLRSCPCVSFSEHFTMSVMDGSMLLWVPACVSVFVRQCCLSG